MTAISLAAGALLGIKGALLSPLLSHAKPDRVMLVYVGADDCAPCRTWQRDAATTFRHAREFSRLAYREVKSPSVFDLLQDEHWPEDLRTYRARLGTGAGVPLWLVIADGNVVARGSGLSQWHGTVLPAIRSLLD